MDVTSSEEVMFMLLRFDPFQVFDRLSREVFSTPTGFAAGWMPMDAWRRGDVVEVAFDLPGIDPESVDLTIEHIVLTVKAERRWQPDGQDQCFLRERPQGTFTRQLVLSDAVDLDKIEARYDNGVLYLTAPVAESARPHKIEIKAGTDGKAITGSSKTTAAA
jgi:HSP20 family protein